MIWRIIPWQTWVWVGAAVGLLVLLIYLRWDAVQDYKTRLEIDRAKHIQDARGIENETRNDSDDVLIDCLRGAGC